MSARRKKQSGSDDFGARMAAAYGSKGASIALGKAVLGDTAFPDAANFPVQVTATVNNGQESCTSSFTPH